MDREMEEPLQPSLPLRIDETSHLGNGSAGENPAPDLVKSESERIKNFYQTVLSAIMVFVVAALSSYKDMKPPISTTSHNSFLVAEGLLIFMTFLCAVVLVTLEMFVYQHGRRGRGWLRALTILVMVTAMMLILADTVLVVITNRNNVWLSAMLVPVTALVIVVVSAGAWMEERRNSDLGSMYDEAMKGAFGVATNGTLASFGLQGVVVFGYLKAPGGNQGKPDPPLDLAACYAASTVSLVLMMVCAMPLAYLPDGKLKVLVSVVERLRRAVVAALAMMALVVSVEFLDGFVVLSVFPEAVAVVLYSAVHLFSEAQPWEESSPHDFAFRILATAGFTLMAGLYAAFLGTDHYSVYLKAAMFLLLLAVLSSLSRLAVPLHVPEVGGAVALAALAFPAVALLSACPFVLIVLYDHYLSR